MSMGRSTITGKASDQTTLPQPWYQADTRVETRRAAVQAIAVERWICRLPDKRTKPDEFTLFVSLHVCAYHVCRRHRDGVASSARRWYRKWRRIREHIVESNLGLAYTMARKIRRAPLDHDELMGDAMIALARAVDHFNPWRGYRFSTYACNVIARALIRRVQLIDRYRRLVSVHAIEPFEPATWEDHRTELYVERLRALMDHNRGLLTELESRVIAQRFPSDAGPQLTFRQIGSLVGLSKERVRQIQNTALQKLREALDTDPLLR